MIATVAPPPSSPVRSLLNIGTTLSATQPSATPSWIASFTTLTVCNSPEKACESRTPAIKLLTPTQTPEPITHVGQSRCSPSREAAAHDRLKSPLTISEMRTAPLSRDAYGIESRFTGSVAVRIRQKDCVESRLNSLFDNRLCHAICHSGHPEDPLAPTLLWNGDGANRRREVSA